MIPLIDWVRIRWILADSIEWSEVMDRWMAEVILCGIDPALIRSESGQSPLRACIEVVR